MEVSGFPAPKKVLIVTVDVKQNRTYVLQFLRVKPGREKDVFGPLRSTSLSFSQTVTEGRQAGKKKRKKKKSARVWPHFYWLTSLQFIHGPISE